VNATNRLPPSINICWPHWPQFLGNRVWQRFALDHVSRQRRVGETRIKYRYCEVKRNPEEYKFRYEIKVEFPHAGEKTRTLNTTWQQTPALTAITAFLPSENSSSCRKCISRFGKFCMTAVGHRAPKIRSCRYCYVSTMLGQHNQAHVLVCGKEAGRQLI